MTAAVLLACRQTQRRPIRWAYPSAAIRSEIVEVHGGRSVTVTSYRRAVSKELG